MQTRATARILLLDPEGAVLLMKIVDSALPEGDPGRDQGLWITLGGGVREGEDVADAARRELLEEVGVTADVGTPWWYGEQVLHVNGTPRLLKENFFVARCADRLTSDAGLEPEERAAVRDFRWWSATELAETDEAFVPAVLPELIREAMTKAAAPPGGPTTIALS